MDSQFNSHAWDSLRLVRERLKPPTHPVIFTRITPARAGKTQRQAHDLLARRDHPRSRGKDVRAFRIHVKNRQSPPLARERQLIDDGGVIHLGITPARAGKTISQKTAGKIFSYHPRSRGKDNYIGIVHIYLLGSPPLARERPAWFQFLCLGQGITPARAGKT